MSPSIYDWSKYNTGYYLNGALAGGICCGLTHGGMCPVDVVKTRIQLDPVTYNKGLVGGFRQVIAAEGAGALATGLGPTAVGYFIQGWFKFGHKKMLTCFSKTPCDISHIICSMNVLNSRTSARKTSDLRCMPYTAEQCRLAAEALGLDL